MRGSLSFDVRVSPFAGTATRRFGPRDSARASAATATRARRRAPEARACQQGRDLHRSAPASHELVVVPRENCFPFLAVCRASKQSLRGNSFLPGVAFAAHIRLERRETPSGRYVSAPGSSPAPRPISLRLRRSQDDFNDFGSNSGAREPRPHRSGAAANAQTHRTGSLRREDRDEGPAGVGPSSVGLRVAHGACVTALSAFTCPCPYQEL
jgi:hypothetical protein